MHRTTNRQKARARLEQLSKEPAVRSFVSQRHHTEPFSKYSYHPRFVVTTKQSRPVPLSKLDMVDKGKIELHVANICRRLNISARFEQSDDAKLTPLEPASSVLYKDQMTTELKTQTTAAIGLNGSFEKIGKEDQSRLPELSRHNLTNNSGLHNLNSLDHSQIGHDNQDTKSNAHSKIRDPEERKKILQERFPEIGNPGGVPRPFPKNWPGPQKSIYRRQLDSQMEGLFHKIFYYQYDRSISLGGKQEEIIGELKRNAQSFDKKSLVVETRLPTSEKKYEFGTKPPAKRKAPRVFGLHKIVTEGHTSRHESRPKSRPSSRKDESPRRHFDPFANKLYYQTRDYSNAKIVFEVTVGNNNRLDLEQEEYEQRKADELRKNEASLLLDLQEYQKVVTDVFMTENAKKKTKTNLMTIELVERIVNSMKNIPSILQVDSRMQGLYNDLENILLFRNFNCRDAIAIFEKCSLVKYQKDSVFMFNKNSNLIILLRGRFEVNEPAPIERDHEGNIVPESLRVVKIKGGNYENMYFSLVDGDYLAATIFKFINKREKSMGIEVKCLEDCVTLQAPPCDLIKDNMEKSSRGDFYGRLDFLCRHKVFGDSIGHVNMIRITKASHHLKYSVGETIIKKGDLTDGVYILIRGAASIIYRDDFMPINEDKVAKSASKERKSIRVPLPKEKK